MPERTAVRAHRVDVVPPEPLVGTARYDYADCFEIRGFGPDRRSAEQFARAALEGAPRAARWVMLGAWRYLIGFRMDRRPSRHSVLGWPIVTSQPDLIHLEAVSPRLRGLVIGRRLQGGGIVVSTFVFYSRSRSARLIWSVTGPVHRRFAPYLLERAAAAAEPGVSVPGAVSGADA